MAELPTIWVLNGPNLNMLGTREPAIYGSTSLFDIEAMCRDVAETLGLAVEFRQSNREGELVDWIQEACDGAAGLALNAGAYTHTSVALHDALRLFDGPIVEVHLSNVFAREAFRHHSFVSPVATGVICGFGSYGYIMAVQALAEILDGDL